MKATQRDFSRVAAQAAGKIRIAWFCGPDEGGASAAVDKLISLLPDPGERIEFSGAELKADPARLGDEARSASLFGGARHIFVRATGDEAFDALSTYCELIDAGVVQDGCPVIVFATSATDKSRSAKLLAPRADSLMAIFHPADLKSVADQVHTMAAAAGIRIGNELAERIARGARLDVRLAQSEITKLATYLDASPEAPRQADAEALDAIGATTEEDGFMPLVNAVLSGRTDQLAEELHRLHELSLNPVGVLLAFERRTAMLAQLNARRRSGTSINSLLEAEQRAFRIFFRDRKDLAEQLPRWNARRVERLVMRLAALHRQLLGDNQSAELMLAQELTEITRFAAGRQ